MYNCSFDEALILNDRYIKENGDELIVYPTLQRIHVRSELAKRYYDEGKRIYRDLLITPADYNKMLMGESVAEGYVDKWEPFWTYMERCCKFDERVGATHMTMDTHRKYTVKDSKKFLEKYKEYTHNVMYNRFSSRGLKPPCITLRRPATNPYLTIDIDMTLMPQETNHQTVRQIKNEHYIKINNIIVERLKKHFGENINHECFVLMRREPYVKTGKDGTKVTKDGLHMEYPFIVQSQAYFEFLYYETKEVIERVFDDIVSVKLSYDSGSYKGNWSIYGSTKPIEVNGENVGYLEPYKVVQLLNSKRTVVTHKIYTATKKPRADWVDEYELPSILVIQHNRRVLKFRADFKFEEVIRELEELKGPARVPSVSAAPVLNDQLIESLLMLFEGTHLSHNMTVWFCIGLVDYLNVLGRNPRDYLGMWLEFCKLVRDNSYNENKCKSAWNSYCENYNPNMANRITYRTVLKMAKDANAEGFKAIMRNDEFVADAADGATVAFQWDAFSPYVEGVFLPENVVVYNQKYIQMETNPLGKPVVDQETGPKGQYIDGVRDVIPYLEMFDTLVIWSNVNTGKTTTMVKIIETYTDQRILLITFRISLAEKLIGTLRTNDFIVYNEHKGDLAAHKKVIIQLDSLHRVSPDDWDVVIIDEINMLLQHFDSSLIRDHEALLSHFSKIVINSEKLVLMDAYMTPRVSKMVNALNRKKGHVVLRNLYSSEDQARTVFQYRSEKDFSSKVIESIKLGKRIAVVSMSKNKAEVYAEVIKTQLREMGITPNVHVYTGDTIKTKRNELRDVNASWANAHAIIYTQTIVAGISYDVGPQFDTIFMYASPRTGSWDTVLQMLNRVRSVSERNIHLYIADGLANLAYRPRIDPDKYSNDAVEALLNEDFKMRNSLLHSFSKQLKQDPVYNWVYMCYIENAKHAAFSYRHFRQVIEKQLVALGCQIVTGVGVGDEQTVTDLISDAKNVVTKNKIEGLFAAPDITFDEEQKIRNDMIGGVQITDRESFALAKAHYKNIYRTEQLTREYTDFYDYKKTRIFSQRCAFYVHKDSVQHVLDKINRINWGDESVQISRRPGEPDIIHIEKHLLARYIQRMSISTTNPHDLTRRDPDGVVFAITTLHRMGIALNWANTLHFVDEGKIVEPITNLKKKISRQFDSYNRLFGNKTMELQKFMDFTPERFLKWLSNITGRLFGVTISRVTVNKAKVTQYALMETEWPYPLYSNNDYIRT